MKRIAIRSFLAAMVIFCASGVALSAPMGVKVKNITGKVEAQSGAAWNALKDGDSVAVGVSLRTGPSSSCVLVWAGGNTAKLGPLTNMKVASAEKDASGKESSTMELKSGKLVSHAKKLPTKDSSFNIKTPTAVAGVRGTDPIAEVTDDGQSSFSVAAGSIEVMVGDESVVVEEGYFVEVDLSGQMSEPEIIPQEVMEEFKEDLKEVNDEATKAEAEVTGAAGGEGQGVKVEPAKEEAAKEEGVKEEAAKEEVSDETADNDAADATGSVDSALDTTQSNDVVDSAHDAGEGNYVTGDMETTIYFGE